MADIPTTPASVAYEAAQSQLSRTYNVGQGVNAGDAVYLDTSVNPNVWMQLSAGMQLAAGTRAGITVNTAALGQPVAVAIDGAKVSVGGTLGSGQVIVASRTGPGNMSPVQDLQAGDYLNMIGYTNELDQIVVNSVVTAVPVA